MYVQKIHVACSPLTNTIYAGKVLKDGMTWAAGKSDVTSEAINAVIQHIGIGNVISLKSTAGGKSIEIQIREVD